MVEKLIISLLKGASAVVYIAVLLLVLSIPAIFIFQAFLPPQFVFDSVGVAEDLSEDSYLTEEEKAEGWTRIEFSLIANAGKFSPYTFHIEKFGVANDTLPHGITDIKITLDDTIVCTKDSSDPFTLTVYIKGDTDINEFIKSVSFKATDFEKSFGEFSLRFIDGKATLKR